MADLKNLTIDDTEFLKVPVGTTAQRPANPQLGMLRWNTETGFFEIWTGTEWESKQIYNLP